MTRHLNRYERRRLRDLRTTPTRFGDAVVAELDRRTHEHRSRIAEHMRRGDGDLTVLETSATRIGEFGARLEAIGNAAARAGALGGRELAIKQAAERRAKADEPAPYTVGDKGPEVFEP